MLTKLKKFFIIIGVFCITMYKKVIANSIWDIIPAEKMISTQAVYGVPPAYTFLSNIFKILQWLIIPFVIIIGGIAYLKKSSSSTIKKIIIILGSIVVVELLAYIVIQYILRTLL